MFKTLKSGLYVVVVGCPDGLAAAITGLVMELVYRASVALKYLEPGYEYLSVAAGFTVFVSLFVYRTILYFHKQNRGSEEG